MKRIGIFHQKLFHADKSASWSCLVAIFGLNLINHAWQLLVTFHSVHNHVNGCFFMRHAKKHIMPSSVFKAQQFLLNGVISSRKFPKFSWHNNRKQNLLTTKSIHFLANDFLHFFADALCWWKHGKNPCTDLLNVACTKHKNMAFKRGTAWRFFQSFANKMT